MAPADLVFDWGAPAPLDLTFGLGAAPSRAVTFTAALAPPGFGALALRPRLATIAVALPAPGFGAAAEYGSDTQRPLVGHTAAAWQPADLRSTGVQHRHQQAQTTPAGVAARHALAQPLPAGNAPRWGHGVPTAARHDAPHATAVPLGAGRRAAWQTGVMTARAGRRAAWGRADPARTGRESAWQERLRNARPSVAGPWGSALPTSRLQRGSIAPGLPLRIGPSHAPWHPAMRPPAGRYVAPPPPQPPIVSRWSPHLVFDLPWPASLHLVFGETSAPPPPPSMVVVPIRSVYMTANLVTLQRVSDSAALTALSLRMSIDADSWTWSWSASLPASDLPLVESPAGEPLDVEATINGIAYRLLIERIARDRQFGKGRITVSGRGRNARLAAPYAGAQIFGNALAARTAQQLMDDALLDNGIPIGWAVDFGLDDWLVPAGAWSHQGTRMTALQAIADAAGGYLQPHRTAQTLRVLHRWPLAPWDWGGATPDLELPSAAVVREAIEWVDKPYYNRVFVSGAAGGGILGQVTRDGTAGDWIAPMAVDSLITHADAARQRGRAVLSDTGRQAAVSLSLPVLVETSVIEPGALVRYVDGATTRIGLVRSTAIDAQRETVRQTIGVQTHVA